MKSLILDYEYGSKTLGSESEIENTFGCPVLRPTSWKATKSVLGQIWSKQNLKFMKHFISSE